MLPTFYQLNNEQDDGQCTESSVTLIPKYMGLTRTEYPSWAFPSDMTDGHGLVEEYLPRGKKDGIYVVISLLYHLENFPKLINIGWGVSVSEPNFASDGVKVEFRNEFPKAIGEWICLLIKGGDTTKIVPLPPRAGGH